MSFQFCFVFKGFCLSIFFFVEVIVFCRPECIRTYIARHVLNVLPTCVYNNNNNNNTILGTSHIIREFLQREA